MNQITVTEKLRSVLTYLPLTFFLPLNNLKFHAYVLIFKYSSSLRRLVGLTMDGQHQISEHSLSEKERALQEKIVRLEKKLEGYQSQIGNTHKSAETRR